MTQIDGTATHTDDVSDRSLRVFCAAIEHGSLTEAGRVLGLGQPAVSHAVSRLETALGVRLLRRGRRGVEPTADGATLHAAVASNFASIDAAVQAIRTGRNGPVTLSVSTSLASWWLLPRLPEFRRQHPDIDLRLVTADTDDHVQLDDIDLWIPLGIAERRGAEFLCDEAIVPVATPQLAERLERTGEADLTNAPLVHLEERYVHRYDWRRWFDERGLEHDGRGDRSNDYSLVIQAALDGQGVALGWRHIVADLVTDGRLVALADAVVTEHPFTIVTTSSRADDPGVIALREWLIAAFARVASPI